MGGVSVDTGGGKGKKSLDSSIPLVPFIDLLSCCIAFLLMTAVWTQVSKLQVLSQGGQSDAPPPDQENKNIDVRVIITERGFTLTAGGVVEIPKASGGYDIKTLRDKLKAIKATVGDTQRNITVASEDAVAYEDLVKVVDICNAEGFPDVTVAPAVG
jgi:biopolymer transport protein TolR